MSDPAFDAYAEDYDTALEQGLTATGEGKDYFARGRVAWLARRLRQMGSAAGRVLDFGCGTGSTGPLLAALLPGVTRVVGLDVSARSIEVACRRYATDTLQFYAREDFVAGEPFDVVYTNGVFHHIPPAERGDAIRFVRDALRAGGLFAFYENNPWNPGTRWVMDRCAFDRDAVPIAPSAAVRLLRSAGFSVVRTDSVFFFPRSLSALRLLEPWLAGLPLGGQYLCLGMRE